jgi:hypothetical protein
MPERRVRVTLEFGDEQPSTTEGIVEEFTPLQRLKRGGGMLAGTLLLTLVIAFIPIVHLIGVPLVLIGGLTISVLQMRATARLRPVQLACPKCGGVNRIGGGLGMAELSGSSHHMCEDCRRDLVLRIEPEPDRGTP